MRVWLCAMLTGLLVISAVYAALAADEAAPAAAATTATASEAADIPAVDSSLARAMDCCHPILVLQGCLKHRPRCIDLDHKCLTPYAPCPTEICPVAACHEPLTPCSPEDRNICRPRACHKPLTVFMPEEVCAPACAKKCKHTTECGCDKCSAGSNADGEDGS